MAYRVAWLPRARGQATRHRARGGVSRCAWQLSCVQVVMVFGCMIASPDLAATATRRASLPGCTAGVAGFDGVAGSREFSGNGGNTDFSARLVVATPIATLAGRWRCCGVGGILLRRSFEQCRRLATGLSSANFFTHVKLHRLLGSSDGLSF